MLDLHLHLDGALTPDIVLELAQLQHIALPVVNTRSLKPLIEAPRDCPDLNRYLECFSLPVRVLQSAAALELAAYSVTKSLRRQGLQYAEIRFAPQLHTKNGLTQTDAVRAVWNGLSRSSLPFGLILCCMRGAEHTQNMETVQIAERFCGNLVCGVDLAGAEALFPTELYAEEFQYAAKAGIPFTIHAGEASGPESVRTALRFGASRIGHGIRAAEDEALMKELAERQIPLELCPTSNLQTKASTAEAYPLRRFLDAGIPITINTDNPTVSQTTIAQEFLRIQTQYDITEAERLKLLRNAEQARFVKTSSPDKLA